jgi:predicted nucleic acid-binding protein
MIVVADTSPVLHLGRIGRLDLLPTVVERVTVPRTVWGELVQPGTRADVLAAIESATWIDIVDDPVVHDLVWIRAKQQRSYWPNRFMRMRYS